MSTGQRDSSLSCWSFFHEGRPLPRPLPRPPAGRRLRALGGVGLRGLATTTAPGPAGMKASQNVSRPAGLGTEPLSLQPGQPGEQCGICCLGVPGRGWGWGGRAVDSSWELTLSSLQGRFQPSNPRPGGGAPAEPRGSRGGGLAVTTASRGWPDAVAASPLVCGNSTSLRGQVTKRDKAHKVRGGGWLCSSLPSLPPVRGFNSPQPERPRRGSLHASQFGRVAGPKPRARHRRGTSPVHCDESLPSS